MKLLLYCTKRKPDIMTVEYVAGPDNYCKLKETHFNGKVVAECDFEIKELKYSEELLKKSCLTASELFEYIKKSNTAYEIHIKNLHKFAEPKELRKFFRAKSVDGHSPCWNCKRFGSGCERCNIKAPQNMMYVFDGEEKKVLISIRPEWLCKILNGEKTIELRKKILKEMFELEDE